MAGDTSHSGREEPGASYTLTVRGTDLAGKPDNGDTVQVLDADNLSLLPGFQDTGEFHHGMATFRVPAGHFWVFALFRDGALRLDMPSEITVAGDTTVATSAGAATSRLQFETARPVTVRSWFFKMIFETYQAPAGCCTFDFGIFAASATAGSIYVSPEAVKPQAGTLTQITQAELGSPAGTRGVPYLYSLAYQALGVIPKQDFVVHQGSLATEDARFYASAPHTGYLGLFPEFQVQRDLGSDAVLAAQAFPQRLTMYFTADPALSWATDDILYGHVLDFSGGQTSAAQTFLPGQRLTVDWGGYPLHPVFATRLTAPSAPGDGEPVISSVSRSGNELGVRLPTLGDNTPGHTEWALNWPFKGTGSYQLDQNGKQIASKTMPHFSGWVHFAAPLSATRSRLQLTVNAAQPVTLSPLSGSSSTTWRWWSSPEPGATVPPGWACTVQPNRDCAVQPLLSLRYGVMGMGLTGTTPAGQQVVRLSVGHQQLAAATRITGARVAVSFDGGRTWQQASLTGHGGSYAAVFDAPAGAKVTLRTTATDAAGGSVSQTITDAYQVATG